jgi:hypothetical protein
MNIHQSLAEANFYRAVAMIPEQAAFGLALANSSARTDPETERSLRLGQRFCDLLIQLSDHQEFRAESEQDATIVSGLKELRLPSEDLAAFRVQMQQVKRTIDALLIGELRSTTELSDAGKILRAFAATAKQKVARVAEAEHLLSAW